MRIYSKIVMITVLVLVFINAYPVQAKGWEKGSFKLKKVKGRDIFIDPSGKPFYSIAMCYAWGPDTGKYSQESRDMSKIKRDMEFIKRHGFNTLNLYGLYHLDEVLTWCDENKVAFYPRMSYYNLPDFPQDLKEFPDFMDTVFRKKAKKYFNKFCAIFKKHPSVLAIDMDQRWMFPLDWGGENHIGKAMLGSASIKYLPKWMKKRYKKIAVLNRLWKKDYRTFKDIIKDKEIIKGGIIHDLKKYPWRLDIYEYTLWTINDFLKDLTSYIRKIDNPGRLITITTEMPEVCPFPLSTKKNSGIDFISPVHYNAQADYNRDWISLGELLYMVKWHSDLQDMPSYISETGFRTSPLKQKPPFKLYAYGKEGDEDFIAEMYLRQTALQNIWPWMTGWTHFKFYDKLIEGDFGYINDDRTLKPIAKLGQYINNKLPINYKKEKDVEVWIFYPEYAVASPYASYQQFKSLVLMLEYDFLTEFERMIQDNLKYIKNPSSEIVKTELFSELLDLYEKKWVSFKFISKVPKDDKPIILAGRSLEQLSVKHRKELKKKNVITMVMAGIEDERCNKTEKWFFSLLDLKTDKFKTKIKYLNLNKYFNNDAISSKKGKRDGHFFSGNAYDTAALPKGSKIFKCIQSGIPFKFPPKIRGKKNNIRCKENLIEFEPGSFSKIHFLASAHNGDTADQVKLVYTDGSSDMEFLGETVTDWHYVPAFGYTAVRAKDIKGNKAFISHLAVNCNVTKKIKAIILPDNSSIHIFAITFEGGAKISVDVNVKITADNMMTKGKAYWLVPVEKDDVNGEVLAEFNDGKVAVVQSKDKSKTVFLYDALTWKGHPEEISRDVKFTADLLKKIMAQYDAR